MKRIGVAFVLAIGFGLGGAQAANASTKANGRLRIAGGEAGELLLTLKPLALNVLTAAGEIEMMRIGTETDVTYNKDWGMIVRRIVVGLFLATGVVLGAAQNASAATYSAQCSNSGASDYLENYLNGTKAVNNGDVVKLTGICTNQSFDVTNTHAFTLEGVGNQSNGTPSSGFMGINTGSGSAILDSGSAVRLTVKNLIFENAARTSGGGTGIGFDNDGVAVTITHDTFVNLSAPNLGGAIQIEDDTDGAGVSTPTVISHNVFTGNSSADGGAIYWSDGSPLKLLNNVFTGNSQTSTSTYYPVGGAVDIENYEGPPFLGKPITISGNTFGGTATGAGNSALGAGGALFISVQGGEGSGEHAQTVVLSHNRFIDNAVTGGVSFNLYGGAVGVAPQIREYGFKVNQTGNLFKGNKVTGALQSGHGAGGGAEWGIGVPIVSTRDQFIGNQVNVTGATSVPPLGGGVGILSTNQNIAGNSSTTLVRASFTGADDLFRSNSDPSTDGWGGAIYTGGVTTINCSSPTACPSRLTLSDTTIVANSVNHSTGQGAAIWGGPADSLTLRNSIVFGNTGAPGASQIFGYSSPKYAYDDACKTAGGKTPLSGPHDICANPLLTLVGAETSRSPTIDRGSNLLVPKGLILDVVGHKRITEGRPTTCKAVVDMGAYESPAVKPASSC